MSKNMVTMFLVLQVGFLVPVYFIYILCMHFIKWRYFITENKNKNKQNYLNRIYS